MTKNCRRLVGTGEPSRSDSSDTGLNFTGPASASAGANPGYGSKGTQSPRALLALAKGSPPLNLARRSGVGSSSKRKQPEKALHKQIAEFLDAALPPQTFWFPIPNGSKRDPITAAKMKQAREVKAGVPDLCIINRGKAIFVELKAGKNGTTAIQDDIHLQISLAGAITVVSRSVEDLSDFLSCIMTLKAHVQ